jgi:hypothetical protein
LSQGNSGRRGPRDQTLRSVEAFEFTTCVTCLLYFINTVRNEKSIECERRSPSGDREFSARRSPAGDGLPVRLKACLIGEVEVLFRYTLSGL